MLLKVVSFSYVVMFKALDVKLEITENDFFDKPEM